MLHLRDPRALSPWLGGAAATRRSPSLRSPSRTNLGVALPRALAPALGPALAFAIALGGCAPDGGGQNSGGGDGGAEDLSGPAALSFTTDEVDPTASGEGTAVLVDPKGVDHVLYFAQGPQSICMAGGSPVPYRGAQLWHRSRAPGQAFGPAVRVSAGTDAVVNGLSALIDPKVGRPIVSYQGGQQGNRYCGGSDMMLARFDGAAWKNSTVADKSTAGTMPVETSGDVVGAWSALAYGGDGALYLAWRDMHFAFAKDDFFKSDLEVAVAADGQTFKLGEEAAKDGAGVGITAAVDGTGRLVLAYSADRADNSGVNVAVRGGPGVFAANQIVGGGIVASAVAVAPRSGRIGVAYYDGDNHLVRLRESTDGVRFGEAEVIDRDGDTGRYVALRYDAEDRPVLAYYNCGTYRPGQGCDPSTDAARVARRLSDGRWVVGDVDKGGDGACGAFISLALDGAGKARVAYQCNIFDHQSGQFKATVRHAHEN